MLERETEGAGMGRVYGWLFEAYFSAPIHFLPVLPTACANALCVCVCVCVCVPLRSCCLYITLIASIFFSIMSHMNLLDVILPLLLVECSYMYNWVTYELCVSLAMNTLYSFVEVLSLHAHILCIKFHLLFHTVNKWYRPVILFLLISSLVVRRVQSLSNIVCVCSALLYVNCFGRTMLYMCIEYHM